MVEAHRIDFERFVQEIRQLYLFAVILFIEGVFLQKQSHSDFDFVFAQQNGKDSAPQIQSQKHINPQLLTWRIPSADVQQFLGQFEVVGEGVVLELLMQSI